MQCCGPAPGDFAPIAPGLCRIPPAAAAGFAPNIPPVSAAGFAPNSPPPLVAVAPNFLLKENAPVGLTKPVVGKADLGGGGAGAAGSGATGFEPPPGIMREERV